MKSTEKLHMAQMSSKSKHGIYRQWAADVTSRKVLEFPMENEIKHIDTIVGINARLFILEDRREDKILKSRFVRERS